MTTTTGHTPRPNFGYDANGTFRQQIAEEQYGELVTNCRNRLAGLMRDLEEERARHQEHGNLQQTAGEPAIPTPDSTLAAMGEIMTALNNGSMTAADAKARLYAHQIALSAMRTLATAAARRKKEARLWRDQTNSRPPRVTHASPRREARRQDRQTKTKKTTASGKRPRATSTPNSKKPSQSTRA